MNLTDFNLEQFLDDYKSPNTEVRKERRLTSTICN